MWTNILERVLVSSEKCSVMPERTNPALSLWTKSTPLEEKDFQRVQVQTEKYREL